LSAGKKTKGAINKYKRYRDAFVSEHIDIVFHFKLGRYGKQREIDPKGMSTSTGMAQEKKYLCRKS